MRRALVLLSIFLASCNYYHQKGGIAPSVKPDPLHPSEPLQPLFSSIKRNIFQVRCVSCHNPTGDGKNVPLDQLEDLTDSPRELVLPGDPDESGLIIALTRDDDKRMPPPEVGGPLSADEISIIRSWIQDGAKP
jgi:Planctomycete cytochrome C